MDTVQEKMSALLALARNDPGLRRRLLETRREADPMAAFCRDASACGFSVTPGEMVASGEEYCSNLHKSVNGGASYPIEGWDDEYELFLAALELAERSRP